jgi:hypothetical protein
MKKQKVLPAVCSLILIAFSNSGQSQAQIQSQSQNSQSAQPRNESLSICSKLDFDGIVWSKAVNPAEYNAMALALNISGSFEGGSGWQNLTNNFDGQGFSYGLLNQCLGQGSLQPLLIEMRDRYPSSMRSELSPADLNKMLEMLSNWESYGSTASVSNLSSLNNLSDYGLSALDDPNEIQSITGINPQNDLAVELLTKNQESVNWAASTLYSGTRFKSVWSSQLESLAQTPGYRSIQVEAAVRIHQSAVALFKHFKLKEVRSYLFLFDIFVQNGGLPQTDIKELDAKFASNSISNEAEKLKAILSLRLTHVKAQFRGDVKSRKLSIINGSGRVHGIRRNYAKEFCAQLNVLF